MGIERDIQIIHFRKLLVYLNQSEGYSQVALADAMTASEGSVSGWMKSTTGNIRNIKRRLSQLEKFLREHKGDEYSEVIDKFFKTCKIDDPDEYADELNFSSITDKTLVQLINEIPNKPPSQPLNNPDVKITAIKYILSQHINSLGFEKLRLPLYGDGDTLFYKHHATLRFAVMICLNKEKDTLFFKNFTDSFSLNFCIVVCETMPDKEKVSALNSLGIFFEEITNDSLHGVATPFMYFSDIFNNKNDEQLCNKYATEIMTRLSPYLISILHEYLYMEKSMKDLPAVKSAENEINESFSVKADMLYSMFSLRYLTLQSLLFERELIQEKIKEYIRPVRQLANASTII